MGFVADAVGDVAGKIGNQFGFGGGANQFRVNENYAPDIQKTLGNQNSFIQALQQQMSGNGPSVAQQLLKQQTDANNANAASAVGSARGLNPALAQRLVLDQQAQNNQKAAQSGGLLRAQEMLGTQSLLGNTLGGQLSTLGGMQQGVNQINAGVAGQNANISSNAWGGLMNGGGGAAALGALGLSAGGEVPDTLIDPMTYIGIHSVPNPWAKDKKTPVPTGGGAQPYGADSFLTGDMLGGAAMFDAGGAVPGKARARGDSADNDTVPAMLSPGEVVLPRSVAQAEDAPEKAAQFVRAIRRQKEPEGYGKVLQAHRALDARLKRVEAMARGGLVGAGLMTPRESAQVQCYADGGEVNDRGTVAALAEALKHLVTRSGPSQSSPSVFDAKTAIQERNRRLQQALEGAR